MKTIRIRPRTPCVRCPHTREVHSVKCGPCRALGCHCAGFWAVLPRKVIGVVTMVLLRPRKVVKMPTPMKWIAPFPPGGEGGTA